MSKLITTHNKSFHADEVIAVALLKVFTNENIIVNRVDHNTSDFSNCDMVIDIGKKFDGIKFFDHHQYKGGKSSAGLIWDYLELSDKYSKISKLIDLIDKNDTGIEKAKPFEFSSLIKCFNSSDLNSKLQDEQFNKAVEFTMTIITSMKNMQEELINAKEIVKNSFKFDSNANIIELVEFTPHWTTYINGNTMPNIKVVVWEDIDEGTWKAKVPSKRLGSFELNGKAFKQDKEMIFVHSAGHFAIAKYEKQMKQFLKEM
jgi:uncharacterized UPF0160 family protein